MENVSYLISRHCLQCFVQFSPFLHVCFRSRINISKLSIFCVECGFDKLVFHQPLKWKDLGRYERNQSSFYSSWNLNCAFAFWDMSHIKLSLTCLNKKDLGRTLLDYQGKLNNVLNQLKNNLDKMNNKFCKIEPDSHISWNVNDKMQMTNW